jgi:hypothetical protein
VAEHTGGIFGGFGLTGFDGRGLLGSGVDSGSGSSTVVVTGGSGVVVAVVVVSVVAGGSGVVVTVVVVTGGGGRLQSSFGSNALSPGVGGSPSGQTRGVGGVVSVVSVVVVCVVIVVVVGYFGGVPLAGRMPAARPAAASATAAITSRAFLFIVLLLAGALWGLRDITVDRSW